MCSVTSTSTPGVDAKLSWPQVFRGSAGGWTLDGGCDRHRTSAYGRDARGQQGSTEERMITLTDKAAEKVKEIATAEGLTGQGLRLQVKGGGCSGFQYDLYFDEKPTDMDQVIE